MSKTQKNNLENILHNFSELNRFRNARILLISPNLADYRFWKKMMPSADVIVSTKNLWDLNKKFGNSLLFLKLSPKEFDNHSKVFDLVIAQNVFMYLANGEDATKNIAEISDYLFLQDITYRRRNMSDNGYGLDGDVSRYALYPQSNAIQKPIQISSIVNNCSILFQYEYEGYPNQYHSNQDLPIHFLILLKLASRTEMIRIRKYSNFRNLRNLLFHWFCKS
jgi:hypothetical protein